MNKQPKAPANPQFTGLIIGLVISLPVLAVIVAGLVIAIVRAGQ